jgi:hypothetical protein
LSPFFICDIGFEAFIECSSELFNEKDEDFQLRYFSNNTENSLQLFKLQEIIYSEIEFSEIEW